MAKKERKNMNRVVEFLQPYSTKEVGETMALNMLLAARLVDKGVAKYTETEVKEVSETEVKEVESKPKKKKNKNEKV
jgi:hypothetical protein